jgi:hypothetical protein
MKSIYSIASEKEISLIKGYGISESDLTSPHQSVRELEGETEIVLGSGARVTLYDAVEPLVEPAGTWGDKTKAANFISLSTFLAANRNYQVLTATMGTNGNGGMLADAADLKEGGIDGYEPVTFTAEEFAKHCRDAGTEGAGEAKDYLAYDRRETDRDGYYTGLVSRIYVDLIA